MKIGYDRMFRGPRLYSTMDEYFTDRGDYIDETKASRRLYVELMLGLEVDLLRVMMPLKAELR